MHRTSVMGLVTVSIIPLFYGSAPSLGKVSSVPKPAMEQLPRTRDAGERRTVLRAETSALEAEKDSLVHPGKKESSGRVSGLTRGHSRRLQ